MIVVGVDPGARETGLAVVSTRTATGPNPIRSSTIRRGLGGALLEIPLGYLETVVAAVVAAVRELEPDLLAVEGLSKPKGFARGQKHTLDPEPVIATGIVLGAVLGRGYGVPVVVVPAGGNGAAPMSYYPAALRPAGGQGKGHDKLRHERAAYDVATKAPGCAVMARARGTMYA